MDEPLDEYAKNYNYSQIIDYTTVSYATYLFLNDTKLD